MIVIVFGWHVDMRRRQERGRDDRRGQQRGHNLTPDGTNHAPVMSRGDDAQDSGDTREHRGIMCARAGQVNMVRAR